MIFHWIYSNYHTTLNELNFTKALYLNSKLNNFFFSNLTFVIFKKLLKTTKLFQTTQLYLSFKYWVVKYLLKSKTTLPTKSSQLALHNKLHLNQYYTPILLTNISLLNKFYRKFIFNTLLFSLHFWPSLNKTKLFTTQYLIVTGNIKLFMYYNNYFFKIFHI
jgi:hypothetical protein